MRTLAGFLAIYILRPLTMLADNLAGVIGSIIINLIYGYIWGIIALVPSNLFPPLGLAYGLVGFVHYGFSSWAAWGILISVIIGYFLSLPLMLLCKFLDVYLTAYSLGANFEKFK